MTVKIIAEIGVNHDGDLNKALKLCDEAKEAGADVVKFQTFHPNIIRDLKARDTLSRLALSAEQHKIIVRHSASIGIEFCSTPDSTYDLRFLVEECGVKRIKIGSGSLLYEPLVDACFDTGLPILLSTGMATCQEVRKVVARQYERRFGYSDINHLTVMHCVSLYPCPAELANVRAVLELQTMAEDIWPMDYFDVGYSDHTMGAFAACAAVTLGAAVVEKHLTLNVEDDGPDHGMSESPAGFKFMVDCIRNTEKVLGTGLKEPSEQERAMIPRVRKDAEGFQPGL